MKTKTKQNFKGEWFSLKSLMNNKDLVIKKADKGGVVVVMSSHHYETMVYKQLKDESTY